MYKDNTKKILFNKEITKEDSKTKTQATKEGIESKYKYIKKIENV